MRIEELALLPGIDESGKLKANLVDDLVNEN